MSRQDHDGAGVVVVVACLPIAGDALLDGYVTLPGSRWLGGTGAQRPATWRAQSESRPARLRR
jgi:hypothetical protein